MSIFFIVIIASNARLATAGSGSVIASVRAIGVIWTAVLDDRVRVAVGFFLGLGRDMSLSNPNPS